MVKKEEQRLRRSFRRILLVCLAAPAAPVACTSSGQHGESPPPDANTSEASAEDATLDSRLGFVGETYVPDTYVDWCEAGPPQRLDGGDSCNMYLFVPCGLPTGVELISAAGDLTGCDRVCVDAGSSLSGCELMGYADASAPSDGGTDAQPDASGDASNGGVVVDCTFCLPGRRPPRLRPFPPSRGSVLGAYLAQSAQLEAASVHAFRLLRRELASLGAPASLLRAAGRAARDEVRHTRIVTRLARREGTAAARARVGRTGERSIETIARENAVEGCVRETWSALLAVRQAEHAGDRAIADAMRRIAVDETRHAALAWAAARFLDGQLDGAARSRVAKARQDAVDELLAGAATDPHPMLQRRAGLPSAAEALRMLAETKRLVWS